MSSAIPKSMLAVLAGENGGPPAAREVPVPVPDPGQVLVRMAAAPINPSDIGFLQGSYGAHGAALVVPGFEGSGTVVAAGAGLLPRLLLGKRVACSTASGGTWAEYHAANASLCVPLKKDTTLEQGAMLLVNPLTALALLTIARRGRHTALVSTAAASALGRMILRLGLRNNIPVINIVRRQEQTDLLRSLGAKFVLVSADPSFSAKARRLMNELQATLILDAVGGGLSQQLLEAAPFGSTLMMYANLSGENFSIDPRSILIRENKRMEGFFLGNWARSRTLFDALKDVRAIRQWAATDLRSHVQKRFPQNEAAQAIAHYQSNMTAGKVLLVADQREVPLG